MIKNDYIKAIRESLKNTPGLMEGIDQMLKDEKEERLAIAKDLLNIKRLVNKEIEKRNKELDEIDKSINKFFDRKW